MFYDGLEKSFMPFRQAVSSTLINCTIVVFVFGSLTTYAFPLSQRVIQNALEISSYETHTIHFATPQ
ncbi:hypothetical protein J8I29_29765, partial [Labrys sp. LIt4]